MSAYHFQPHLLNKSKKQEPVPATKGQPEGQRATYGNDQPTYDDQPSYCDDSQLRVSRCNMTQNIETTPEESTPAEASSDGLDSELVAKARASIGISRADLMPILSDKDDYDKVLMACARNAKMGPFTATSGLILDYYLNVSTNMMDPAAAPSITRMCLDVLQARYKPDDDSKLFVVGMEMAGGVMVGQCAAVAPFTHPSISDWCEFVYCRKDRKTSGTCQQLEAATHITDRTPASDPVKAVFMDDCMSSGGSMRDAVLLLKNDYNIDVIGSLYLVDRSRDRIPLDEDRLGLTHPAVQGMDNAALFDLDPDMHDAILARKV